MTRRACADDIARIVAMGQRFIEQIYPSDVIFNGEQIARLAQQMIESPDGDIFLAERAGAVVGMLAIHAYPHPMSGEQIATEVCWWVDPEYRGIGMRLFRDAERWAKSHDAKVFQMIAPSPEVARFYERIGFKAIETTYQRRVA